MPTALLGYKHAPADVVWPPESDTELVGRTGWTQDKIRLSVEGPQPYETDAMVCGVLAVHRMTAKAGNGLLAPAEGWTISTVHGQRITCGARVFASCPAAMRVAEQMGVDDPIWIDWTEYRADLPSNLRAKLVMLFESAEANGEIMRNLVTVNG